MTIKHTSPVILPTDILQLKCLLTKFIKELQVFLDYQNIICRFSYIPFSEECNFWVVLTYIMSLSTK